jgi:hypothetical protein
MALLQTQEQSNAEPVRPPCYRWSRHLKKKKYSGIVAGESNKAIAARLFVPKQRSHINSIYKKAGGFGKRKEAIAFGRGRTWCCGTLSPRWRLFFNRGELLPMGGVEVRGLYQHQKNKSSMRYLFLSLFYLAPASAPRKPSPYSEQRAAPPN